MEIILQPPHWGPEGEPAGREALIGKVPGFVLATTDCRRDYEELSARGVEFIDPPMEVPWGISALFVDLYGHVHNLVQARDMTGQGLFGWRAAYSRRPPPEGVQVRLGQQRAAS